jgi:hypothetical protein
MKIKLLSLLISILFYTMCPLMAMESDDEKFSYATQLASQIRYSAKDADKDELESVKFFLIRFKKIASRTVSTYAVFLDNKASFHSLKIDKENIDSNYSLESDPDRENLQKCFKVLTKKGLNRGPLVEEDKELTRLTIPHGMALAYPNSNKDRLVFKIGYKEGTKENIPPTFVKDFYLVQGTAEPGIKALVDELNSRRSN